MAFQVMGQVLVSQDLIDEMGGLVSAASHVRIDKHGDGSVSVVVYRCGPCADACEHTLKVVGT